MDKKYILGIDTSNYCTSVAVVDQNDKVICSIRELLEVPKGQRGLRQQDALFQHGNKLPELIGQVMNKDDIRTNIAGVAISVAPRQVEGSYMPVFLAGYNAGKIIAETLGVPLIKTFHQNGHIQAALLGSKFQGENRVIGLHFSGGTTEALLQENHELTIVGATKDISIGQLIDRVGVKLGHQFPAGKYLDQIAIRERDDTSQLIPKYGIKEPTKVRICDCQFNLSGSETYFYKLIEQLLSQEVPKEEMDYIVSRMLFEHISTVICQVIDSILDKYGNLPLIFFGGVIESKYLRNQIEKYCESKNYDCDFAAPGLSGDNAVGVAIIGGKHIWHENQ